MSRRFLDRVYETEGAEAMRRLYADWAGSYDDELAAAGYATPGRVAAALAAAMPDPTAPVLDFGCGTGLSGLALTRAGCTTLDGVDVSEEMLAKARAKGVYRHLDRITEDDTLEDRRGRHAAVAAIGVIGPGAAPLPVLDRLWALLPPGGLLALSFNDHALADPAYEARIRTLTESGAARLRFREHGPHLPAEDMNSTVYVLERT